MIRVLLVDDQELVREGLRRILHADEGFEIVGECADGVEVQAAAEELCPDVVVMDVRMKQLDGIEATRRLRARARTLRRSWSSPPSTTMRCCPVRCARALSGFVLKDAPGEELVCATRAVAEGEGWLDPSVTERVLARFRSTATVTDGQAAGGPRTTHGPRARGPAAARPRRDQQRHRERVVRQRGDGEESRRPHLHQARCPRSTIGDRVRVRPWPRSPTGAGRRFECVATWASADQRSTTAKAIVQDRYGSADVLELRTVEDPVVGEHDVLVRVRAAGCGPDVWHIMTGLPYMARVALGFRKPKIRIRGWDVAGTVEAVGSSVDGLRPGDDVMGTVEGSFAELAVGAIDKLVAKPARLGFEAAAAVPVSGATALQAVRDQGQVGPGQRVLVIGAAGAVGSFAVQIAKAFGANVTGVCSTSKLDLVRSIGADEVIDYTREVFTDGSRRWDLIVDTAGRRPLSQLRRALTPNGTLVIVGGDGGGPWTGGFFRGVLRAPLLSLFVGQRLRGLTATVKQENLRTLTELIDAGKVTPIIDRTYPLAEAADAVRYLAEGHPAGKVVIAV